MHESDLNESAVIGLREIFAGGGPLHVSYDSYCHCESLSGIPVVLRVVNLHIATNSDDFPLVLSQLTQPLPHNHRAFFRPFLPRNSATGHFT